MTDGRDPAVEAWLDSLNVTWSFEADHDLGRIDRKASRQNQARDVATDPEVVERYAAAMADDEQFPALIVRSRKRSKKTVIVGGNHRLAAYDQIGRKAAAAYIVDVEPEMAMRLAIEDNSKHGNPPSREERISHGLHLMALGMSQVEASKVVRVSATKLSQARSVASVKARIDDLGVVGAAVLPFSTLYQLSLLDQDAPLAAAAQLAVDHDVSQPDMRTLVEDVRKTRSETKALQVIGDARASQEAIAEQRAGGAGGARRGPNIRVKLMRELTSTQSVRLDELRNACAIPEQRAECRKRLKEAARHYMELEKGLR